MVSFTFDRPSTPRLMVSLNALLAEHGDDIYRVYGILQARGDERRHVLQGAPHPGTEAFAALVGRNTDQRWVHRLPAAARDALLARLQACLAANPELCRLTHKERDP